MAITDDTSWLTGGPKTPDTSWTKPATTKPDSGSVVAVGGVQQAQNQKDYNFTMKFGQDNNKLRAQDQSAGKQGLLAVGNGVANIVTGLVEGIGYIPELFDKSHDYSNALTQAMQAVHNPFGEIYRENPEKTFDLGDSAWWLETVQQLGESFGAFALEGIGLAKIFGGAATTAAKALQAGVRGTKVAMGAAETLSAATLAYTEGAMSGYRIYDEVYKNNYEKQIRLGTDPAEAHKAAAGIASDAAATTVRTNTLINTVFNLGELAPLFHGPKDEAVAVFRNQLKRTEGESLGDFGRRIVKATAEEFPDLHARHGWTSRLAEMGKEGIEEVNTQYAEEKGKRVGKGQVVDGISDVENYINDISNSEGALNFVLGSIGGGVQTMLVDHIPSKYSTYDKENNQNPVVGKDGNIEIDEKTGAPKYKKYLVSPKTYNEQGTKSYFESLKGSVQADITRQQQLTDRLTAAAAAGNQALVEQTRNQLFSIGALDATNKGLTANWQEEYKQIATLDNTKDLGEAMQPQVDEALKSLQQAQAQGDNELTKQWQQQYVSLLDQQSKLKGVTEAVQKGFAKDNKDNGYKTTAMDAVQDLKHLQDLHEHVQKKYLLEENGASGELADHLFFRQADLYLRKRALDREEKRLNEADAIENSTLTYADQFNNELQKYNQHIGIWTETMKALQEDQDDLEAGRNIKDIVEKYRAKGTDPKEIAEDLVDKIQGQIKKYQTSTDAARINLETSTGYTVWKESNPKGTFQEYRDSLQNNILRSNDRANLEYQKAQHEIAATELQEVTSTRGLHNLYDALAKDKKKMLDAVNARMKNENTTAMLAAQSKAAAAKLNADQKEAAVGRLTEQLNKMKEDWNALDLQRVEIQKQLQSTSNFAKQIKLRGELALITAKLKYLRNRMNNVQEQLSRLQTVAAVAQSQAAEVNQRNEEVPQPDQDGADEMKDDFDNEYQEPFQEDPLSAEPETFYTPEELMNLAPEEAPEDSYTGRYLQAKKDAVGAAQIILSKLESEHKPGTKFSLDTLTRAMRPLLTHGMISQTAVNELMITMPRYLEEKNAPIAPVITEMPDATPEVAAAEDATPEIIYSNQPRLTDNTNLFTEEELANAYWEQSAKTTDAVKGNSSDLQYTTIQLGDKRMLRNITVDGAPQLDTKGNRQTMVPGYLFPGRKVALMVDTDWDGTVVSNDFDEYDTDEGQKDRFENYVDANGKIRTEDFQSTIGYGNMPIKVVDATTGETLKYFPRVDWITMTKGLGTFRNVENLTEPDADGNRYEGNVAVQQDKNLAIRKKLAEEFNKNPNARLETTITGITPGRVLYFGDLNVNTGKVKYRTKLAKTLLPDPALKFAVANRSGIMVGKDTPASNLIDLTPDQLVRLKGTEDKPRASAVVLIPMNNGLLKPEPLETVQLGGRPGEMNTIFRAIELYMQHNPDAAKNPLLDKIEEATGFDLATPGGLKNFIEQYYTHTSGFSDSRLVDETPISGKKVQEFMLDIPDRVGARKDGKADIKVGTLYTGMKRGVRAELKDGKLSQKFIDAATAGLASRFKTVAFSAGNIKGLNDTRPMNSISIDKNDKLSIKKFDSYNDYLKSFVSTSVYGQHQVDGKYVYAANGQAMLDASTLLPSAANSITELVASTPDAVGITPAERTAEDIIGDFEDELNFNNIVPQARTTIQGGGPEVTVANLAQLRNFIPAADRNSLSAEEVYNKLQALGISQIADGYNPFQKC